MALADDIATSIAKLNAALSRGVKIVQLNGKHVEYQSVDQLIKARDDLQRQLDALNATKRPRIVYHTMTSRGY